MIHGTLYTILAKVNDRWYVVATAVSESPEGAEFLARGWLLDHPDLDQLPEEIVAVEAELREGIDFKSPPAAYPPGWQPENYPRATAKK